jgi:hypothetical protein
MQVDVLGKAVDAEATVEDLARLFAPQRRRRHSDWLVN